MRVLTAQIRLALLSIIETLLDLVARFRAGTLPPLLPAAVRGAVATIRQSVPAET